MIYLALILSAITGVLFIRLLRTRNQLEMVLVTEHRDFMKSLKVNFLGRPVHERFGKGIRETEFSIEVDGRLVNYRTLFENRFLLSTLNDVRVNRLSARYVERKKLVKAFSVVCGLIWLLVYLIS